MFESRSANSVEKGMSQCFVFVFCFFLSDFNDFHKSLVAKFGLRCDKWGWGFFFPVIKLYAK